MYEGLVSLLYFNNNIRSTLLFLFPIEIIAKLYKKTESAKHKKIERHNKFSEGWIVFHDIIALEE